MKKQFNKLNINILTSYNKINNMNQKPSINTGLTGLRDLDALHQAKVSYSGLLGSANFTDPEPPLIEFLAAITDFDTKLVFAHNKFGAPKAAKNAARIVLNEVYSNEGHYVNRICKGNLEMLLTSRFVITEDRSHKEIADFSVVNGTNPGDLDFSVKANDLANSYEIEFRMVSKTTPNDWAHCTTMGSHIETISGFTSGVEYEFRMRFVYSKSKGPYFNSIQIRVL